MPKVYEYRARDCNGMPRQGIIAADGEEAVAEVLRGKKYFITSIKEQQISIWRRDIKLFEKKMTTADLALYVRQFSIMIDAGMPLLNILNVLVEQTENKQLKRATRAVLCDVQGGETLARAMGKHTAVFPAIMVSLVEAGELGGALSEILDRLAAHLEKEHRMVRKIKGAMTYPAVILAVATVVVSGIITFILPTFAQLFRNAERELPLLTQLLIFISRLFREYYIALCGSLAVLLYSGSILLSLPRIRPQIDMLRLQLPVWGDISKKATAARFCRTLATLLHGGVNILSSLEAVKKIAGNYCISRTVTLAQSSIKEGRGLAPPLLSSGVFPVMAVRMIAVGEETGEMDKLLEKVADFLEAEVEDKLNDFHKLIEPLLIVVLAVIIGTIVVSIMLPMFEMSSVIH